MTSTSHLKAVTKSIQKLHGPLHFLQGLRLVDIVGLPLEVPVFADNDARVALAGEVVWGAARGLENVLMLTLGNGVGGAIRQTVCTVLPSDRVVTLGLGFGGVLGVGVGGGWVTVAAVWPLGQVTGAGGVVSVGTAVATGASAMTSRPATEAAAQPRGRLRVGRAVDMSRGGYGIVLRRAAGYTPERPTASARVRSHG